MTNELKAHFARIAMTLSKVFRKDPEPFMHEYRSALDMVPEQHKEIALHEEPYDVATRLMGWRDGGVKSDESAYRKAYEALRQTPQWDNPEWKEKAIADTVEIVRAYVSHNKVDTSEIGNFIRDVHNALISSQEKSKLHSASDSSDRRKTTAAKPAVPISNSVTPDWIVCLEDGKKLKMLKRHLQAVYKMTPEEYRSKWGLPEDYPMVAPNYAQAKRESFRSNIEVYNKPRNKASR